MVSKTILLIDDDQEQLDLMTVALRKVDLHVVSALNGQEGLTQFYEAEPDLVILDLMLPDIGGWQVYEQIRQISNVPVLILSAVAADAQMIRGLELGVTDYLVKPISFPVLATRVRKALNLLPGTGELKRPASSLTYELTLRKGEFDRIKRLTI